VTTTTVTAATESLVAAADKFSRGGAAAADACAAAAAAAGVVVVVGGGGGGGVPVEDVEDAVAAAHGQERRLDLWSSLAVRAKPVPSLITFTLQWAGTKSGSAAAAVPPDRESRGGRGANEERGI
jgi:hypothetical protein